LEYSLNLIIPVFKFCKIELWMDEDEKTNGEHDDDDETRMGMSATPITVDLTIM